MKIPKTAADVLDDHVVFEVECIDRVYLNLYQAENDMPPGLTGGDRRTPHHATTGNGR